MAAGLATFREVLTRENYVHVGNLSKQLTEGYRAIVKKCGLLAYVASAGVNGALMLYPKEIQNYRDWTKIDVDLWRTTGSAWSIEACWRSLIGGTSSGPSPCSIPRRMSTNTSQYSKKSHRPLERPGRARPRFCRCGRTLGFGMAVGRKPLAKEVSRTPAAPEHPTCAAFWVRGPRFVICCAIVNLNVVPTLPPTAE